MNVFLIRNNQSVSTAITILMSFFVGLYINLLTKQLESVGFIDSIQNLSWKNLLLVLVVALLIFQIYTLNIAKKVMKSKQEPLINAILEAASKSLVHPKSNLHIRAIVTVCDNKINKRVTRFNYNTDSDPERIAEFDKEFGITGEAFTTKSVILKQLPTTHHRGYNSSTQNNVLREIKTILAAPILKSNSANDEPFGILAFDSKHTIEELNWNTQHCIKGIAQEWADILSEILVDNKIN